MMNISKRKILHIGLPIAIFVIVFAWFIFELKIDDAKGEENVFKKIYYQVARLLPAKAAVRLAVPYHQQERSLSCEVAALLMALKYRGVSVTESESIQKLPFSDPGPRHKDNTWGDPNLGFVGSIDGHVPNTGYGVYEKPIYDLAVGYQKAQILASGSIDDLITELVNGNPVVVWGVVGSGKDISWKTPDGQVISAKFDEHARTLIGYTGTSDKPILMILLDPIYGEIRMKVADFLKNWQSLDNKAVVIF